MGWFAFGFVAGFAVGGLCGVVTLVLLAMLVKGSHA